MAPPDHPQQQQQQSQSQSQPFTPSSASTIYASPASEHQRLPPPPSTTTSNGLPPSSATPSSSSATAAPSQSYPYHIIKTEESVDGNSASPDGQQNSDEPPKKKQKRNKPTLSCHECVERKTKPSPRFLTLFLSAPDPVKPDLAFASRLSLPPHQGPSWSTVARGAAPMLAQSLGLACDRGRPHCLACIKRQTECKYAHVANLLEETTRSATNGRRMTKPPKKKPSDVNTIPNIADRGLIEGRGFTSRGSVGSIGFSSSTGLLSNVPYSLPTASNVFGIGSEHPFANYWTCEGGLPEVISVLPDKIQADILLAQYFECVDPVYPMMHRQTFYADYEHFWSLGNEEKNRVDAAFVGLIFVMLALGTQFVTSTSPRDGKQTAEFYASASNQALRLSSYLSAASLRSIQAMVLLTYFLINDNHASDGWAFAGILIRQAYAMGLHRDPNIVTPDASIFEKQQRRKVWQAVLLQDTFLTVLVSLPPSATHTDVSVEDLLDDGSAIAASDPTDIAYIRGSWTLANLVQETICSPRSLDMPICTTARHKSKLVADFRAVYRSFPDVFRSWDSDSLTALSRTNKRVVRQTLFLTSNYHHNIMLVHASESPDVPVNVRGTLEAAHEAINSFFLLFNIFELEARVWWVFNHRAFLEALCIGSVLRETAKDPVAVEAAERDPLFVRARADISRMIQIMELMGEGDQGSDVARARVQVLKDLL